MSLHNVQKRRGASLLFVPHLSFPQTDLMYVVFALNNIRQAIFGSGAFELSLARHVFWRTVTAIGDRNESMRCGSDVGAFRL
jgi:hypothetical protein